MSVQLLPYIDAPALQIKLVDFYQSGAQEPSPEVQFIQSTANTNRVLETSVVPGNGHIRSVQVLYTPRITEGEIGTSITADCDDAGKVGDLSHTYTIDTTVGVQHSVTITLAELKGRMEANPDYFARITNMVLDGVRRKLATGVATQMAALNGRFAVDNGETGLSLNNYLKTVKTRYAVATDGGKMNPEALQEINFSAMNSGFRGTPWVLGFGEIQRYFSVLGAAGTFSDGGMDWVKYINANGVNFLPSFRMHTALNGNAATNKFLVVDTGALHLLQYNKYDDPSIQTSTENLVMGILTDPLTGTSFNYKFYLNPCGEKVTIWMSTSYKVVGLPDDMFAGGDRLEETNGVLQFAITNS